MLTDSDVSNRMKLREASDEFMKGYFATNERVVKTRTAYSADLAQFRRFASDELELTCLCGAVIEDWSAHLRREGYLPASMRRKMAVLKVFCSYWVRKGVLPESPFWRVKLSFGRVEQLPRTLSEREMRKLLVQARSDHSSETMPDAAEVVARGTDASCRSYRALRNLALVDLLFATGIRVSEASSLDIRDLRARESIFRIQGKGGRDRLAFVVDKEAARIQREHLEARKRIKAHSPALFLNASGGRLSTQGMRNVTALLRRGAGIERNITPHMLRHTVATLLLRNGADIRVVQEFLGHASIATTQRYTHVAKEHLVGVLRKRHPSLAFRFER